MKKTLVMALAVMMMTLCSAQESKALIAYFSASGTTKSLSEDLAKATGADPGVHLPYLPWSSLRLCC